LAINQTVHVAPFFFVRPISQRAVQMDCSRFSILGPPLSLSAPLHRLRPLDLPSCGHGCLERIRPAAASAALASLPQLSRKFSRCCAASAPEQAHQIYTPAFDSIFLILPPLPLAPASAPLHSPSSLTAAARAGPQRGGQMMPRPGGPLERRRGGQARPPTSAAAWVRPPSMAVW